MSSYTQGVAQYNEFINDTKGKIGSLPARFVGLSSSGNNGEGRTVIQCSVMWNDLKNHHF